MDEMTLDELVARAAALRTAGTRKMLGLAGSPGSGKSTLAQRIVAALPARSVNVPMDGFHLANVELHRLGRSERKGAQDTFDSAGYVALLERMRVQAPDDVVYAPEFRREIEEPIAGAIAVLPTHELVVTEGNYLLLDGGHWRRVREVLDEIWFVDIDPEVRLARLFARHIRFGRDEQTAHAWIGATDEPNARAIESTRSRADVVVRIRASMPT